MNVQRPTNSVLATAPLVVAGLFAVLAVTAAIFLAPNIERKGTASRKQTKLLGSLKTLRRVGESSSLDTRIKMLDMDIKTTESFANSESRSNDSSKKLGGSENSIFSETNLKKRMADLVARRDELIRQRDGLKAELDIDTKVEPWYEPYLSRQFIGNVLDLTIFAFFGLMLVRAGLTNRLPASSLILLTNRESGNLFVGAGTICITLSLFAAFVIVLGNS